MNNFIYVFNTSDRDAMIAENYTLLKSDEKNNIYIFMNKPSEKFSKNIEFIFSDTLTF